MSFSSNLASWLGSAPNALIGGRVDANAQVVGDKTGYSLTAGSYSIRASSTQRGTIAFNTVDTQLDATVTSVTETRAVYHGHSTGRVAADNLTGMASSRLAGATTITANRNAANAATSHVTFDLAEFF